MGWENKLIFKKKSDHGEKSNTYPNDAQSLLVKKVKGAVKKKQAARKRAARKKAVKKAVRKAVKRVKR